MKSDSNTQTCLTDGEYMIKKGLEFISRNCRYYAASLTAAA